MKKTKKIIISVASALLILGLGIFIFYKFFYDENRLNLTEKEWLNSHKTTVISFNIPNDLNIFSKAGKGVFYDFLKEFEKENEITINKNIIRLDEENGLGFAVNKSLDSEDLLFFKDHYVIVSKNYSEIKNVQDLNGKKIGGLSSDVSRMTSSYGTSATYAIVESKTALLEQLNSDKVSFIIVPLNEYLDEILANNYKIVYHLNDIEKDYYINLGDDKILNSIVTKYYNNWIKKNYEDSFYKNSYNLFNEKLRITQIENDALTNKTYVYGFVSSTPFQTLNSSRYGGKIINYLEIFSKFSNVEFTYTKFKNNADLVKAFNNKKVDLILNNTSLETENAEIKTNIKDKYYIISPLNKAFRVSNIDDIKNQTIYVLKDSKLAKNLSSYKNLNLAVVKNEQDLLKKTKKNELVALSSDTYNYYINKAIKNYQIVYEGYNSNYTFKYLNENDIFYKVFSNYVNYLSEYEMTNQGIISYSHAESNGNFISSLAKYILIIIAIAVVVIGIVLTSKKDIRLNTKIRKDEKLKFVDMLTALKNRNYLNERISVWNQNTIYPQAIIVIDLNNIKYLNDTFGHEEGDKQIMAAANILHQTQLDNTEIMRTDGNEFMIYLVGYNEKQVLNYMKKLVKEFNNLPYEYGAAFGFSMIVDDLKLIDDAINEATIKMRENKELENEKSEEENE